jgi:hypothetical protein
MPESTQKISLLQKAIKIQEIFWMKKSTIGYKILDQEAKYG